ncbi:hypothetical protein GGR33_004000, partial [Methylobacterium brachythecii]|nr:hypothetical protein [Methylobacterium brachythecii]
MNCDIRIFVEAARSRSRSLWRPASGPDIEIDFA